MIATKRIRVIDLTQHLSGPYCCWLLSTLGAEVIKVERPDGGDPVRLTGPFVGEHSTYFSSINRNKRSIALDLKSQEGKEVLTELLKTADVLVENFRSGVLARLGFSEARLAQINPRLILASITGFGQEGEWAARPAYDIVIQGMGGVMSITGQPEAAPTAVGFSIADISAGVFCALAVQSALLDRERTGEVRRVDIAMLDCQLAMLEGSVSRYLNCGEIPKRVGSKHPRITPFQAYSTADHPVVIAAEGDRDWRSFCEELGLDDIMDDPRFATNEARVARYREFEALASKAIAKRSSAELLAALAARGIPCGPVNTIPEVLEENYVKERRLVSTVRHGDTTMQFVASPVAPRGLKETAAPLLGEHTNEILRELELRSNSKASEAFGAR